MLLLINLRPSVFVWIVVSRVLLHVPASASSQSSHEVLHHQEVVCHQIMACEAHHQVLSAQWLHHNNSSQAMYHASQFQDKPYDVLPTHISRSRLTTHLTIHARCSETLISKQRTLLHFLLDTSTLSTSTSQRSVYGFYSQTREILWSTRGKINFVDIGPRQENNASIHDERSI